MLFPFCYQGFPHGSLKHFQLITEGQKISLTLPLFELSFCLTWHRSMETRHAPLLLKNMGKTWQNYVLKTSKNWCPELEPAQLANPHCSTYIYFPLMPNIHLCIPVPSTCHLSAVAGCQPRPFLRNPESKNNNRPSFQQPHRSQTNDGHLWCCSWSCLPWEAPHGSTPRAASAP